jgi:hypothetical protein
MEARGAHPDLLRELLDAHRPIEPLANPRDRPRDAVGAPPHHHDVLETFGVTRDQEAIDDLVEDQRREDRRMLGRVGELHETEHGIEERRLERADVDPLRRRTLA